MKYILAPLLTAAVGFLGGSCTYYVSLPEGTTIKMPAGATEVANGPSFHVYEVNIDGTPCLVAVHGHSGISIIKK